MLNLFRRHTSRCRYYGKRTGPKCQPKLACPIYYEGTDETGKRCLTQAVRDPLTGKNVVDWQRACEIVKEWNSPPVQSQADPSVTIEAAIQHFLKLREKKSEGLYSSNRRVMRLFRNFMENEPRRYRFMTQVCFTDLTDFCGGWTQSDRTKLTDLTCLITFLRYCHRSDFTLERLSEGLCRTLGWKNEVVAREPFSPGELEQIWAVLPRLADQFVVSAQRAASQTEIFVYLMRYTGMDLSTTMMLSKGSVRGNQILTHRLKNGSEVWTIIPDWVVVKLWQAPHESDTYFFWNGLGNPSGKTWKWSWRLRKLLNLAGLHHRTPHNFRHHFAVEHLLAGTPIEDVSRLLGHNDIRVTLKSYAAWTKQRQERLEQHQRRVWSGDALSRRMASQ